MRIIKLRHLSILVVALLVGCEGNLMSPTPSSGELEGIAGAKGGKAVPEGLVYNEFNGNYYQAVANTDITWTDARDAVEGMSYGQCSAHLATITSQRENDWVAANVAVAVDAGYWIGGFQAEGSAEPDDGWGWVTGENWIYTNWSGGEPNDLGGEDHLHYFPGQGGLWNDLGNDETFFAGGYLVEYECPTKATGGGQALRDLGFGIQKRVYGFNSHKDADTGVNGQAQVVLHNPNGTTADWHMQVTCQSIWGDDVWLGGVVTESGTPGIPVGGSFVWRFTDNGQGGNADSDRVSFYIRFLDNSPIDANCAWMPDGPNFDAIFELERGNVKIHL